MTADADHPSARCAWDAQWASVERTNPCEHLADRTYMRVTLSLVGKRYIIGDFRQVTMNQHALYDFAQRFDVFGQRVELYRLRAHRGHRTMLLVVFLRTFHGAVPFRRK